MMAAHSSEQGGTMIVTVEDVDTLARTLWGEARGEPRDGKIAIAWVILNRYWQEFHGAQTITEVCRAPWQFSCWNADDPNHAQLLLANDATPGFQECMQIANLVARPDSNQAQPPDPTNGATHYHTIGRPSWAKTWPPSWVLDHAPSARIGQHLFYAGIP